MDTWMKVVLAGAMILMALAIFPRARQMVKESPKAGAGDWQAVLLPLALVVLFILLLIKMV